MARIYHDEDADLGLIRAKKVAIVGYVLDPVTVAHRKKVITMPTGEQEC